MEDKLHLAPELLEQAKAADSAAALFALAIVIRTWDVLLAK